VITEPVLVSCLRRYWGLEGVRVTVHNGGMGSQTSFVDLGGRRWVAGASAFKTLRCAEVGIAAHRQLSRSCDR
jgi:hypothetical protein